MVLYAIYFFKSTKLETLFGYAGRIATTLRSNKHWFTLDSQMTIEIGKNGFQRTLIRYKTFHKIMINGLKLFIGFGLKISSDLLCKHNPKKAKTTLFSILNYEIFIVKP